MDQQLADAWLALESEPEKTAAASPAPQLPAGHAWFAIEEDEDNQAMLLACERRDRLEPLLQHVHFNLRVRSITVMTDDVAVPVVIVLLRIQSGGDAVLCSAWVNELWPRTKGILGQLAEQSHLLIALLDENGCTVGTTLARNVLSSRVESLRGWISNLGRNSPWNPEQFAAAKAYIRSMYPTSDELWARFDEDSVSEMPDQKLEALTA